MDRKSNSPRFCDIHEAASILGCGVRVARRWLEVLEPMKFERHSIGNSYTFKWVRADVEKLKLSRRP